MRKWEKLKEKVTEEKKKRCLLPPPPPFKSHEMNV